MGKVRHGVEANNWDFFANDFHSQLPNFRDDEDMCGAKTIHQFQASVRSKYVFATGTADTALFKENGEKCKVEEECTPDAPYHLIFRPNREALPNTTPLVKGDEGSHWINQLTARDAIPEGTHLFDVYAMWGSPVDGKGRKHDRTPSDRDLDEFDLIGKIETTSPFTTSLWGDEKLFFQHNHAGRDT